MSLTAEYIAEGIRKKATELGFGEVGFAPAAELTEDKERLKAWLDKGYHAGMEYMEKHFEKRTNPSQLVEGAVSVISFVQLQTKWCSPF